jgi:hypothetical protein
MGINVFLHSFTDCYFFLLLPPFVAPGLMKKFRISE